MPSTDQNTAVVMLAHEDLTLRSADHGGVRSYSVASGAAQQLFNANYDTDGGQVLIGGAAYKVISIDYDEQDGMIIAADLTLGPAERLPEDDWKLAAPQVCDLEDDCEACQ